MQEEIRNVCAVVNTPRLAARVRYCQKHRVDEATRMGQGVRDDVAGAVERGARRV